jgi:hypothetical protein
MEFYASFPEYKLHYSNSIDKKEALDESSVVYEFGKPLVIEDIVIDPPRKGEVKVRLATGRLSQRYPFFAGRAHGHSRVAGQNLRDTSKRSRRRHLSQAGRPSGHDADCFLRTLSVLQHQFSPYL